MRECLNKGGKPKAKNTISIVASKKAAPANCGDCFFSF
jgi:hypothetical protein